MSRFRLPILSCFLGLRFLLIVILPLPDLSLIFVTVRNFVSHNDLVYLSDANAHPSFLDEFEHILRSIIGWTVCSSTPVTLLPDNTGNTVETLPRSIGHDERVSRAQEDTLIFNEEDAWNPH